MYVLGKKENQEMAACLIRTIPGGKPMVLPVSLTNKEVLECPDHFCQVSYMLAYGDAENRIEEGQNVLDVMRRKANDLIADSHPTHFIIVYIWGGTENGWLDRKQAKAAGL
jgi:hypothetical protein